MLHDPLAQQLRSLVQKHHVDSTAWGQMGQPSGQSALSAARITR